ncbi:hypothetical protein LOC68_15075 [Blastopirellula sp. JC732]|uniref:Uncharacterized protein n=1 Tax=Blastopirellula sediminis TaxID=2894196 RepID=A0A9X1SKG1_9BACT|nr:hypothetical protein [Blastopirellula sediminis]MCC9606991.1 hypothetical protein [Blastopirellula sediminis]MCC9629714.1 hypothetical protein [Blastopirellula sediminis]
MSESLKIILMCIAAAILYGVCHDMITTRICLEYFTVFHAPVWGGATDPTVLALTWGAKATWWVGLILSIPAVLLARAGAPPKLAARDLVRPIGYLLLTMAIGSLVAGLVAWRLAEGGVIWPAPDFARLMKREAHVGFLIDAWAHSAAYAFGFFGGIAVCIWIWMQRRILRGREALAAREEESASD